MNVDTSVEVQFLTTSDLARQAGRSHMTAARKLANVPANGQVNIGRYTTRLWHPHRREELLLRILTPAILWNPEAPDLLALAPEINLQA